MTASKVYPAWNQIWVKGTQTQVLIKSVRDKRWGIYVTYETQKKFNIYTKHISEFKHEFKYSKEKTSEYKAKILREKRQRKKNIDSLAVGKFYKYWDNQTIVRITQLHKDYITIINIESREHVNRSFDHFFMYFRPILRKSKAIKILIDEEMIRDIIE